jgi:hypothetical protein
LVDQRFDWLAPIPPVMQIEVVSAKRSLSVGDPVHAADGTLVGRVSGMSRDPHGHVERIRITETTQMGSDRRIFIIYDRYFLLGDGIVQLKLSVAELNAMPQAMTEDSAAGSGRPFWASASARDREPPAPLAQSLVRPTLVEIVAALAAKLTVAPSDPARRSSGGPRDNA